MIFIKTFFVVSQQKRTLKNFFPIFIAEKMTQTINDVYFRYFIIPLLNNIAAPAPPGLTSLTSMDIARLEQMGEELALAEEKNWFNETRYARLLTNWIKENEVERKLEISLVPFHQHHMTAFASLLVNTSGSETMIISVAVAMSAEGFEYCFKDIYLNTLVKGTQEENSNEKNCYTLVIQSKK